jgi:NmrA-like family
LKERSALLGRIGPIGPISTEDYGLYFDSMTGSMIRAQSPLPRSCRCLGCGSVVTPRILAVVAVLAVFFDVKDFGLVASALSPATSKVAVIGATGKLGRETVIQLSQRGIATRCLLRHELSASTPVPASLADAKSSQEVASYLATLPGVEMVRGDIATDKQSIRTLLQGCSVCLAMHGAVKPDPFYKSLIFPQILFPEDSDPTHPKQVNYVGVQNLLSVMQEASSSCQRLVRITGKGESPVRTCELV